MPAHQDLLNQAQPFCVPATGEVVRRLPDELMQQLRAAKLARGIPGCRSHHTQTACQVTRRHAKAFNSDAYWVAGM